MITTLLISFFAGFAINFMPCNLPIFFIKIHEIIKYSQTKKNKKNIKLISLSSSIGIVFTFLILSLIAILLKYTNSNFQVGLHFQNTYFLIFVILMLFVFILNLTDIFYFNYSPRVISFIQKKYERAKSFKKSILIENFLSAIFMVLFAIPCSVPLIGSVATLSIIDTNYTFIVLNFLILGLGMSAPFILLILRPTLLNFLKNKQDILAKAKYIVIIIISLTILWLLNILTISTSYKSTILLILFMFSIFFQFKIIKNKKQNLAIIVLISIFAITLPVNIFQDDEAKKIEKSIWKDNISQEELREYINKDKSVFISITAKWCVVCNLNELNILSKFKFLNYIKQNNIIPVRIDITKSNKDALIFYKNKNNIFVPNYIIYNSKYKDGCSFTGVLSTRKFLGKVENCL